MRVSDLTVPGRSLVMGIVNVTEDSFSDGGRYLDPEDALAQAHKLVDQGADMIDVGGESTRPGAHRIDADVERARVTPVIEALAKEGIMTSVDTMRASTARAAAEAGVAMINDVSGGRADSEMYRAMAETGLPVCLMHWKAAEYGDAAGRADHGGDVVANVKQTLAELAQNAIEAGVEHDNIVLDPGLGFAKSPEDNWQLLDALSEFVDGEFPILVGASRKRFLTRIRGDRGMEHSPMDADAASAAVTAISAHLGAWGVRVHDVVISRDAVDVAANWQAGKPVAGELHLPERG